MQKYELTILIKSDIKGEEKDAFVAKMEKIVAAFKGKAVKFNELGQKQLAYPIKKMTEAQYLQWVVELPGEAMVELDRKLSTEKDVLRFLLVKAE